MSETAYIDDGFTRTKTLDGVPGLYPALSLVYRVALSKERHVYAVKNSSRNPELIEAFEIDLVARYLVSINGESVPKEKMGRIEPNVRAQLVDLILSLAPGDSCPEESLGK